MSAAVISDAAPNAWPTSGADRAILAQFDELERAALVTQPTDAAEMLDVLTRIRHRLGAACRATMKATPGKVDVAALRECAVLGRIDEIISLIDQKRDRVLPILFAPAVKQARRS